MKIERIGFGQIEPNHLSAQRNGQIYAQLPCPEDVEILENGQFLKYDYVAKECNTTGKGEWMLVMNEVKLYGDRYYEGYKDFAMQKKNYTEGEIVPRLLKTSIGDIYTTNAVGGPNTSQDAKYAGIDLNEGDLLTPDANGWLNTASGTEDMVWQVAMTYTMPDGQPGVKIQRIK